MKLMKMERLGQDGVRYHDLEIPGTHNYVLANGVVVHNCGVGVGFSVERQFINNLPLVADVLRSSKTVIRVEDSRLGWANAFRELLSMLYQGRIPEWDVSELRPAGARLKTFGGRASGPEPLVELFDFCVETFKEASGRRLNSIECHDISCKVGEIVIAGGVRRSALLSLSNPSDDRMRYAKSGNWQETAPWRYMANNSACYTEKPGMDVFMREWLALYDSKSGERGIFNREAAKKQALKFGRREPDYEWGCNPSLRRGTRVFTTEGIVPIEELEGKDFFVRNLGGKESKAECWLSGKRKPLYEVRLAGGHRYYATAEHEWPVVSPDGSITKYRTDALRKGDCFPVLAQDSLPFGVFGTREEGFLIGWNLGDGWITKRSDTGASQIGFIVSEADRGLGIHALIEDGLKRLGSEAVFGESGELNTVNDSLSSLWMEAGCEGKRFGLPTAVWRKASEEFRRGIVDGLFSSDGCFRDRISLTSSHEALAKDVSDLFGFYGIKTTVSKVVRSGIRFPNGKVYDREYVQYVVRIRHQASIARFGKLFQLSHLEKQELLDKLADRVRRSNGDDKIRVKSVKLTDLREDVWDIRVDDDTHCFQLAHCVTGNCSEVLLRDCGLCNLTEIVIRSDDTEKLLKRKVRLATILGTMQATITDFRYLRSTWRKNAEEESLLGVSLTGIMDNELTSGRKGKNELRETLGRLREHAVEVNKEWAAKLGINPAAAITCVKPSGTVSQLVNCSSGIHARHSKFYIRTVRADKMDPMAKMMVEMGFPHESDVTKPDHVWVFSFPVKSPDNAVTLEQVSAIDQLELWKTYQQHWCEHKPSCTIHIKEGEWMDVGAWVYRNFDEISGISFLPYSGHNFKQAPFQEIPEKQYNEWLTKMPEKVDWDKLRDYEKDNASINDRELACTGDKCELVDLVK